MKEYENYDLSGSNTFRMKVSCARYVEYGSLGELEKIDFDSLPKPLKQIGGGSNLLFTGDFPGTVMHGAIRTVKYVDMGLDDLPVIVGAGVVFDNLVEETCRNGLWGLENLSLIPGETGAAAVQNIGAYGVEMKDVVSGVTCYDLQERRPVKFTARECRYAYRDSFFKHAAGRYVVTAVLLRLRRKPSPVLSYKGLAEELGTVENLTPMQVREAVTAIRRRKLPDPAEIGSAGSFFKNPVVDAARFAAIAEGYDSVPHYLLPGGMIKLSAAWLIDKCSLKGAREGGAAVFDRQPLVIVNADGNAAPEDVLRLEKRVREGVREKFGVELEAEVEHI